MKWAVLGCGQMSSALVLGALGEKEGPHESKFYCFDPLLKNAVALNKSIGDGHFHTLGDVPKSDIYLIGCKPQHFEELAEFLRPRLPSEAVVLSIMAGVSIETIRKNLECENHVIRLMPNRAALVGQGVHAVYHTPHINGDIISEVMDFLNASGDVFVFDSEDMIDKATGISGSGPAYLFLLAELMANKLSSAGISRRTSNLMVAKTLQGATTMLEQNPHDAPELRKSITSKGGVTQAALEVFEAGGFDQLVSSALDAAYLRAKEL
jgi:pyrroline-5-carboxylate reductase